MAVSCLFPSYVFTVENSNIIKVLYIKDVNWTQIITFYLLHFSGSQTQRQNKKNYAMSYEQMQETQH